MSDLDPPYGFALRRNGSCLQKEVATGETVNGFRRCCPEFTVETSGGCCPGVENCTQQIMNPPHCADETWDIFQNTQDDGFFCCVPGTIGFHYPNVRGVGCMDLNAPTIPGLHLLPAYSAGAATTSTTGVSTSAFGTATATSEPESDESTNPSVSNTGAIAGGVVGGVAGLGIILALLWYFMRRRSQKQPPQEETPITEAPVIQYNPFQISDKPSELDGQGYVAELENSSQQPAHELPGIATTR